MNKLSAILVTLFAVALPASVSAAPLTTSPSPVVVPKTTVGYNGEALDLQFTNPGEDAIVEAVSLEGGEADQFHFSGSTCGNLPEGQKCSFYVGLKPTTAGLKQATVTVTFQGGRPPESFPIFGEAVPAQLSFGPASYDFGLQRINRDWAVQNFEVTNSGEAPVQVFNFEIQGDTGPFSLGQNNCTSLLAPGQSCSVQVGFFPQDQVAYAAELRADTGTGAFFSAALSGEGGRAAIGPAANPVEFGAVAVGSQAQVKTIELKNTGNLPGAFFIAVIAGGDVGSFKLLSENCTMVELAPQDSCTVRVRFDPQEPGPLSARLAMFGDSDDATMVQLQGQGMPAETAAAGASIVQYVTSYSYASPHRAHQRLRRGKSLHAGKARYPRLHRLSSAR